MTATDATIIFQAHSVILKYDLMFYLTQNWFLCMYNGIVYVMILKYGFIVPFQIIPYSENLGKNNMLLLKSYQRFTADSPRWRPCWWRHLPMSDSMWSSRGKNDLSHGKKGAYRLSGGGLSYIFRTLSSIPFFPDKSRYHRIFTLSGLFRTCQAPGLAAEVDPIAHFGHFRSHLATCTW